MQIQIKKLTEDAITPEYKTSGAAGADLFAAHKAELRPGERKVIRTEIAVAIPEGYYGRIAPRSGLAFRHGIDVLGGVIDSDYRDSIGVILLNTSQNDLLIRKGDRIAQLVIEQCFRAEFQETAELSNTDRGTGGFGHTGV